uniref:BON domain-containing protein n=1 Tax=Heterorhabditis bacteriophora TaxID=37862 RepID=A0A1I7XRJ2_HETBA
MEIVREKEWETCAHSAPAGYIAGCRRAASFPFFGDHSLISTSALKVRSQSESEALNKYRLCQINLDTFRKRPRAIFEERDEGSECESDSGSSSYDDCDSFCQAAITEVSEVSIKPRKSVRFADDCGKELYCVRVMSEPSDYPPRISPSVIRKLRGESYTEENISTEASATWNILFKQPASEYIRFRERLERDKVSLENVVIKSDGSKIVGTIKCDDPSRSHMGSTNKLVACVYNKCLAMNALIIDFQSVIDCNVQN